MAIPPIPPPAPYTDDKAKNAAKTIKLDEFAEPDDNTNLNATSARHGLLMKLENSGTKFLRDDGTWQTPSGGGQVIYDAIVDASGNGDYTDIQSAITAGSAENWSMYIRVNNTTDYLIQTLAASTNDRVWSNTSLNIAVSAGDYIEIKEVQPAWATNPANVTRTGQIYIE